MHVRSKTKIHHAQSRATKLVRLAAKGLFVAAQTGRAV